MPVRGRHVCFLGQSTVVENKSVFSSFEPSQGKTHELLTLNIQPSGVHNWMPSPDGSRIVLTEFNPLEGRIRILSLKARQSAPSSLRDGQDSIPWTGRRMASRSSFRVSHRPAQPCSTWTFKATPRRFGT